MKCDLNPHWIGQKFVFNCSGALDQKRKAFVAAEVVATELPHDFISQGWGGAEYQFRMSKDNSMLVGCMDGFVKIRELHKSGTTMGASGSDAKRSQPRSQIYLHAKLPTSSTPPL